MDTPMVDVPVGQAGVTGRPTQGAISVKDYEVNPPQCCPVRSKKEGCSCKELPVIEHLLIVLDDVATLQDEAYLERLSPLVQSLQAELPDAKYETKGLGQLVAQIMQFMEDALGINVRFVPIIAFATPCRESIDCDMTSETQVAKKALSLSRRCRPSPSPRFRRACCGTPPPAARSSLSPASAMSTSRRGG